jgi:hypothetical protein
MTLTSKPSTSHFTRYTCSGCRGTRVYVKAPVTGSTAPILILGRWSRGMRHSRSSNVTTGTARLLSLDVPRTTLSVEFMCRVLAPTLPSMTLVDARPGMLLWTHKAKGGGGDAHHCRPWRNGG